MSRTLVLIAAVALVAAAPAAHAGFFKLIPADQPVVVAKSRMTVTPPHEWNHLGARAGRNAESWTLDGLALDDVTFYGGIGDGQTLFKAKDAKDKPLPKFSATMLAPDIVALFEGSYRINSGSTVFKVDTVAPATFMGAPGFRFDYTFTSEDEVERKGEANGAIIDGKLYMETFEAPTIYYYDTVLPAYRELVAGSALK